MKIPLKTSLPAICILLFSWSIIPSLAQKKAPSDNPSATEQALLWEISGKNLSQPSYLFGTFHLLTSEYLQTQPRIEEKMQTSQVLAGEIVMDSIMMMRLMTASIMKENTLDLLLPPDDYQLVAAYFKELTGVNLQLLNTLKPMALQAALTQYEWATLNSPSDKSGVPIDIYLQQQAKQQGKTVIGLESLDDQLYALFDQFSLKRQADMLIEAVKKKKENRAEMLRMTSCYQAQDMECLRKMTYDSKEFSKEEFSVLLINRNLAWMNKLPDLMQSQPTFVAVGAGHLVGPQGLIGLLRQAGYTVKPIPLK
jgi:uncharacterized protein YbaP (TraB family)